MTSRRGSRPSRCRPSPTTGRSGALTAMSPSAADRTPAGRTRHPVTHRAALRRPPTTNSRPTVPPPCPRCARPISPGRPRRRRRCGPPAAVCPATARKVPHGVNEVAPAVVADGTMATPSRGARDRQRGIRDQAQPLPGLLERGRAFKPQQRGMALTVGDSLHRVRDVDQRLGRRRLSDGLWGVEIVSGAPLAPGGATP